MQATGPRLFIGAEPLLRVTISDALEHHSTPEALATSWAERIDAAIDDPSSRTTAHPVKRRRLRQRLWIVLTAVLSLGLILLIASADILANLAGRIVLSFTSPFQEGDHVRLGGHGGRVMRVGLLFTRLETKRHGLRFIPHRMVLRQGVFRHSTRVKTVKLNVHVAYTVSQELVLAILLEAALRTDGSVRDPECRVSELMAETIVYELHSRLAPDQQPKHFYSQFEANLLEVLAENHLFSQDFSIASKRSTIEASELTLKPRST